MIQHRSLPLAALAALVTSACASTDLIATPHVMAGEEGRASYAAVSTALQVAEIPLVYVTDRQVVEEERAGFGTVYGAGRDPLLRFGTATLGLTPQPSWGQLVAASTQLDREHDYEVALTRVEQRGVMASLRGKHVVIDGELVYPAEALAAFRRDREALLACFEPFLRPGDDNEVLLYVHGFNNTFEDAALRLGQLWHALGRRGVPLLYTWPSAYDSWLMPVAYNHDRESGEFSTAHLKLLLITLALHPRISGVHLIAHSRGTDVATTTLREIGTEVWSAHGGTTFAQLAQGGSKISALDAKAVRAAAKVVKLKTVVLAAADMDLAVFAQRFMTQRVLRLMDRLVVYSSTGDFAIGGADVLFASDLRLGETDYERCDPNLRRILGGLGTVEMIECRLDADSHAYLFEHPAALSDLIRVIRDRAPPGAEHGRPLVERGPGFYVLGDDYLRPR